MNTPAMPEITDASTLRVVALQAAVALYQGRGPDLTAEGVVRAQARAFEAYLRGEPAVPAGEAAAHAEIDRLCSELADRDAEIERLTAMWTAAAARVDFLAANLRDLLATMEA